MQYKNFFNKMINEHWRGQKLLLQQEAKNIVAKWIDNGYKSAISPKTKSNKIYTKLLCYFIAIARGQAPGNISLSYKVKDHIGEITFIVDNIAEMSGMTIKAFPFDIHIIIPFQLIKELSSQIVFGYEVYRKAEEIVTELETTVVHELEHAFQRITITYNDSDETWLRGFSQKRYVETIQYVMYFIGVDELKSTFMEAYREYNKQGKYYPNKRLEQKAKRKNFVDILICTLLKRNSEKTVADMYAIGNIDFNEAMHSISPHAAFLIVWTIFVYGLQYSGLDKLILRDDINNLREQFNLQVIAENMSAIKKMFLLYDKNEEAQELLADYLEQEDRSKAIYFYTTLFSLTKSNKMAIKIANVVYKCCKN